MLGRTEAERIVKQAIESAGGDQSEVLLMVKDARLTRFANSTVHQNLSERTRELTIRFIDGDRVGIATTTMIDDTGIRRAADSARRVASVARGNTASTPLTPPDAAIALDDRDAATANFSPGARADAVAQICRMGGRQGVIAAGAYITGEFEVAAANSLGVLVYYPTTLADLHTVMVDGDSTGFASRAAMAVDKIDPEAVGVEALDKVQRGRNPEAIGGGDYEVVLEEYAVADMLKYFGQYAFGATSVSEGTSFMSGRLGQPIMSNAITIWDDGLDAEGLRQPFDFEAVPKRKVVLVDQGVPTGVVHDSVSARRAHTTSTGHALPPTFTYLRGSFPLNMFMAKGTASKADMVQSIKRGIWVSRFHYTAIIDTRKMILTGLTRDGTFLIENGRLTKPLRSMRFVQNCVDALADVDAVGEETQLLRTKLFRDFYNASRVPALKIARFNFTGPAGA